MRPTRIRDYGMKKAVFAIMLLISGLCQAQNEDLTNRLNRRQQVTNYMNNGVSDQAQRQAAQMSRSGWTAYGGQSLEMMYDDYYFKKMDVSQDGEDKYIEATASCDAQTTSDHAIRCAMTKAKELMAGLLGTEVRTIVESKGGSIELSDSEGVSYYDSKHASIHRVNYQLGTVTPVIQLVKKVGPSQYSAKVVIMYNLEQVKARIRRELQNQLRNESSDLLNQIR